MSTQRPDPAELAQRRRTGRRLRDTTPAVAETPAEPKPEKLPPWVPVHPTVPDWREMDRW